MDYLILKFAHNYEYYYLMLKILNKIFLSIDSTLKAFTHQDKVDLRVMVMKEWLYSPRSFRT